MTAVLNNLTAVLRTAMGLLARREYGRVELARKLRQRGACPDMIGITFDRLAEEGLLSESRYLESYISYRANSGYGPSRIREELTQRGSLRGDVEQALGKCNFNWQEKLEDTWRRKFFGQIPFDAKERARQGRFLSYRGYPLEMISLLLSGQDFDD